MKVKVQLSRDRTSWNWRHVLACGAERLWGRRWEFCSRCCDFSEKPAWKPLTGGVGWHLTPPGISAPHAHRRRSAKAFPEPRKVADVGGLLGAGSCHHLASLELAPTQSVPAQTQALLSLVSMAVTSSRPAPRQDLFLKYLWNVGCYCFTKHSLGKLA